MLGKVYNSYTINLELIQIELNSKNESYVYLYQYIGVGFFSHKINELRQEGDALKGVHRCNTGYQL